ncbi:formate/nitrite transporter family protein [Anaerotalea alkaliphila]|uniref:Formate/nitrite transporter family protein n=1 Tax=Anaerotalea alkaliphila TaxID=2662126 RepID=A0A7X5HTY8_9FIRM|nr:formate/nitrite transporter family protein [Anaerotalea alkaliphila]NDL66615.1 formate/nitrite transporter family protein [Anaerotalea alkaliphila]
MYEELVDKIAAAGVGKYALLQKSKGRYFILAMLAGMYVGFGILLIFSVGAPLADSPLRKTLMGVSFGIALSLVVMAGSELFTGNNLVLTVTSLERKVSWLGTAKLWGWSYLGNLAGSVLLAAIFVLSGSARGPVGEFFIQTSQAKMAGGFLDLFFKGVLCNILVCLAVLSSIKLKEETAKLIMIFWCLFAFITAGFEHSIANMTILAVGLLAPHGGTLSLYGFFANLVPVTLGNMVGGAVFVGLAYWLVGRKAA